MKTFTKILLLGAIILIAVVLFVSGVLVGLKYKDKNNLPFIAGGEWDIGIYTGKSPLEMSSPPGLENPVLTPDDVTDMPARQVADPFLVHEDNTWYMFFEVLHAKTNQGNVGYATSKDGFDWTYQKIVLDEPFHLSYPDVFKWQDEYYMIPESYNAGAIRLYKGNPFPDKWDFEGDIIKRAVVDPTFLVYDGKCWIFAASQNRKYLYIFYADSLRGPWHEHPQNSTVTANTRLAPAGRIISTDDGLIRFAMDVTEDYGKMVLAYRIDKLTETEFSEREMSESPVVVPDGSGWNADRMHQFDPHPTGDGGWIACVDGWRRVIQIGWKY